MATLANSIELPLLASGSYVEDMRETIIIVKEINPLMGPYIYHGREVDVPIQNETSISQR